MAKKKTEKGKLEKALDKSPINYFSDLFIVAMVVAWILVAIIMVAAAIYATVRLADTSIWCEVGTLVAMPLSCGGAIWMIKNSVQHAIAGNRGEKCPMDFPAVDASDTIDGQEKPMEKVTEETEVTEVTEVTSEETEGEEDGKSFG